VDAPAFELADHVRVFPIGPAGDEARLLLATEHLRRRRLDRSRPLWEMWFLPGLPAGRVGFYMKVHHAIADGAAGVATLGAFLDAVADAPPTSAQPWTTMPCPSARELFADNLRQRAQGLGRTVAAVSRPAGTLRHMRAGWPAVRETLAEPRAPQVGLNRPIGPDRRLVLVRSSLDAVKQVGHAHQATVNDVLMTVIASGLRDLLRGRGVRVDDLVLRGYVPVSLHRERQRHAQGNLDGVMAVPLPVGVPDTASQLRVIAAETAGRKKKSRPPAGSLLRNGITQRAFLKVMAHQRWANVYVANVPGPPVPLYFAGAPLLEVFPIVPLTGNLPLGVGALSYAGQFNITVVADRDACPDIDIFAHGAWDALDTLTATRLGRLATAAVSSP
jgi:WS/DGAT/MGAT family acyltransferase